MYEPEGNNNQAPNNASITRNLGSGGGKGTGCITSMDHHDMTGDGVRDLIVGRDGGTIEVFAYEDGDELEPTLRFSTVR